MGKAQKRLAAVAAVDKGHYLVADRMSPELKHFFEPGVVLPEPIRNAISRTMSESTTPYGSTPRECSDSASDSDAHPPKSGLIDAAVVHFIPPLGPAHGCHGSAPVVQDIIPPLGPAHGCRGSAPGVRDGAAPLTPPGRWDGQARTSPEHRAAAPPTRLQEGEAALDYWAATLGEPGAFAPLAPPGSWQGGTPQVPTCSAPHLAPPGLWRGGTLQSSGLVFIGPPPGLEVAARARPLAAPPGSWAPRSDPLALEPPPGLGGTPRRAPWANGPL